MQIHHTTDVISFIEAKLANNQIFELLNTLCEWLRNSPESEISARVQFIIRLLKTNKSLGKQLASQLCDWFCGMRLYPLFISCGILGRAGFGRELRNRIYEKMNPSFKNVNDLRDIFFLLFHDKNDTHWLNSIPTRQWDMLLNLLRRHTTEHDRETVNNHLRYEGLFAIEMLAIWIAAEDIEPELMRLDPQLLERDSPFVALQREVTNWLYAQQHNQTFDSNHLHVMFTQCEKLIERLQKKGSTKGSSLDAAYLLERLKQTLTRLARLMSVFESNRFLPRRILLLTKDLATASANQHSVSKLWKQSVKMLARSITQNTSDHGEHYITRTKKEYFNMFYSAAAGGIFIALMALIKVYIGSTIENEIWKGLAESLNYSLGFIIIFMLHFTVATKQPAMTASRFAEAVKKTPQGRALEMKLAQLLIDVFRSQSAAVLGNISVAASLSALVALIYSYYTGTPFLSQSEIDYQLNSLNPTKGTLWFAAIAGIWLFCAGIISGYFDNRCNYLNIRMRLREHPLLKRIMSDSTRERFAEYIHQNFGSIMGNTCFGFMLGLTSIIGYLTGLPLDVRHVALSSANLGYAGISGDLPIAVFLQYLIFVLMIGSINLIVSFSLTLWIALRSLGTEIQSWSNIAKSIKQILKQRPLSLILPLQLDDKQP
ncbi:recombinase [Nicoletella semolina]|nr:recombinase [Nicoletella semolina]MDH2925301.1 recombinase [Nicoletella semolina]